MPREMPVQPATTISPNPAETGLPVPQRYWSMLTLMVGLSVAVLDTAIINVALPGIAKDLHVDAADSIWVVNAYQLAVLVSLLPFASFGDIFGYRRVYRFALVRYTYPRRQLGRAIGMVSLVVSLSAASGPSVAAAILSVAPWPWLFAVNVPIGIVAF